MLTCLRFALSWSIALFLLGESAFADSQPTLTQRSTALDANAPVCYIQIQGSGSVDLSSLCGKRQERSTVQVPVATSGVPVFNRSKPAPDGQCHFIDANGKPCPGAGAK